MFSQVWKKYLPVIAILLKRSVNGEQSLDMNPSDFQRASGGRKIKFSFTNLQLINGRITHAARHLPLARDFGNALLEDEVIRKFLLQKEFEFSMNNNCQLRIMNNTIPESPVETPGENDIPVNHDEVV